MDFPAKPPLAGELAVGDGRVGFLRERVAAHHARQKDLSHQRQLAARPVDRLFMERDDRLLSGVVLVGGGDRQVQ
jgi:hypothetical protein